MRKRETVDDVTVQAIAGTYVVLLGMDIDSNARDGLLGFAIEREDHTENERRALPNFLLFEANDSGDDPDRSSLLNPFQAFVWGDYTAKPAHDYTYRVSAMYGSPDDLEPRDRVEVDIRTEEEDLGRHSIFFNRGVATSQAYVSRFGRRAPDKVPDREAYVWLSRGLEEALLEFIAKADGPESGLRGALYEFTYWKVLRALLEAHGRGADVGLVVAGPLGTNGFAVPPACENAEAIEDTSLPNPRGTRPKTLHLHNLVRARQQTKIPHNKFLVLLRDGDPVEVWTGSTNITPGGIFGHSNTGHVVRDAGVARQFLDYWEELETDPERDDIRRWTVALSDLPERSLEAPDPRPPPDSISTVFSARRDLDALDWYAKLMDEAKSSVFLTAAFGVSEQLREVFNRRKPYLRYLMLDNRKGRVETVARDVEDDPNNRVTAGGYIGEDDRESWRQWVNEYVPTGLNRWVQFIHTKYMLIDPLGSDPIVITGSANFSEASTRENDENMLVIRGDTAVADVYLGEFMRLFSHFRLRGKVNASPEEVAPGPGTPEPATEKVYLRPDDSWADRFFVRGSPEAKERELFSGAG